MRLLKEVHDTLPMKCLAPLPAKIKSKSNNAYQSSESASQCISLFIFLWFLNHASIVQILKVKNENKFKICIVFFSSILNHLHVLQDL